ncbi:MAG TPA: nucleoside-diphosphate kinase [Paludibacteraceae bacterium]|nr:nucleoside-diphosphate kinase [Paludibacteraceae bacterium]HOK35843.1 nucleoside-diphosphate kinase [Paludibacteraceae bacterium]HOL00077.1 nucleoside-diphosphate kinase [Paludibacteraceae bacterium]HPO66962.1 nucleoside-diphosphate kinase [Paludibacteraceae bacterium]HRU62852.1 nucleoside-diphosphate kinase [Paludibacteraceae bacterium]
MEKTLVIIKPGAIQRELIGEVITRLERKGLHLCGIKMMQLTDDIVSEHYAHLADLPFFDRIKNSMMVTPIIVCCWEGVEAVKVVRAIVGVTNGRDAQAGTIRGDFSMSIQENIIHASDSVETAKIEIARFFKNDEIFDFKQNNLPFIYANDEK